MSSSLDSLKNNAASVRDRLKLIAKTDNVDFQRLLNNYAIQKLLVRIDRSSYRENLMLKGSWLFVAWNGSLHRPTKDGFYQGFRTTGICLLANARIKVQVDIGFGDAVTPNSIVETIPCLLGEDKAVLNAYPIYTAISEKWHAISKLGITNSRLKDYYDLYVIANLHNLKSELLIGAVRNTFDRRETKISTKPPMGISSEFFNDGDKIKTWAAFLRKNDLKCESSLSDICNLLERFLFPINFAILENEISIQKWFSNSLKWNQRFTLNLVPFKLSPKWIMIMPVSSQVFELSDIPCCYKNVVAFLRWDFHIK